MRKMQKNTKSKNPKSERKPDERKTVTRIAENSRDNRSQSERKLASGLWLYGRHPVEAALANPNRKIKRLLGSEKTLSSLKIPASLRAEIADGRVLDMMLPEGAVHQGMAIEVLPLPEPTLDACTATGRPILVLDQVTDPHNVGAILRSAAAFDAAAVIVLKHNAPDETGVLAKSASGALELVPVLRVPNLAHTLELLKKQGYWVAGLDGSAAQTLSEAKLTAKTALVLGAEGAGLRRLTIETCDLLVKLPISERMESLNVSNAAAIALYELNR